MRIAATLRKSIRFLLASLLWLHAFFLINLQPDLLSKWSRWLHLTIVETVLFILLIVFSFVAGKSFWTGIANVAYVYFFPFVLFFYFCAGIFYFLRAFARLTNGYPAHPIQQKTAAEIDLAPSATELAHPLSAREKLRGSARVLLRPFNKFTILWCLLLLATTHDWILWAALTLVLLHLARAAYLVIRLSFFSGGLVWRN